MVTDQRGKSAYAVVEITVVNDRKKPEFQNLPYIIEALREDIKNNTNIQRIQATNPNGQVCAEIRLWFLSVPNKNHMHKIENNTMLT